MANICLPVQLDAFILNPAVVDGKSAVVDSKPAVAAGKSAISDSNSAAADSGSTLIAPITLPDYVSLRLNAAVLQHDILPPVDLHNARPAVGNPRISRIYSAPFSDLQPDDPSPEPETTDFDFSRCGVYLHWSLPRGYRVGTSTDKTSPSNKSDPKNDPDTDRTAAQPTFKEVPNRWLLVRFLRDPRPQSANVDPVAAWVIESDRLRKLNELPQDIDLETEVTPMVAPPNKDAASVHDQINNQAEMYIGYKTPLKGWSEDKSASRVSLTIMNSSNPLFADYAVHNPNVFSTHDNFSYDDGTKFLDSATCDYIVVGWHASAGSPLDPVPPGSDPLFQQPGQHRSLTDRLKAMFCNVPDESSDHDRDSETSRRLVCYSAMYNVVYDSKVRPETPADGYADNFSPKIHMEPVTVGTTPLDAMLTFFEAHSKDNNFEAQLLHDPGSQTALTLRSMTELLYMTQDTYDERIKAADLVYNHNFSNSAGGFVWRYDKKKLSTNAQGNTVQAMEPPAVPSSTEADQIALLNELQRVADAATWKLRLIQWSLFSEFFKYVSDINIVQDLAGTGASEPRVAVYRARVKKLKDEGHALQKNIMDLTAIITTMAQQLDVKRFAADGFSKRVDPTLCLAGIDSGWPADYLKPSLTRLQSSLKGPLDTEQAGTVATMLDLINGMPVADDLRKTIHAIVSEASHGPVDLPGHIPWSGKQPFKPQFIEWEGTYYHVAEFAEQWDISTDYTGTSESNHHQLRYVNPNLLSTLSRPKEDVRQLSGRILLLPQPSFSLAAVVNQVLGSATDDQLPSALKVPDDPSLSSMDEASKREALKQKALKQKTLRDDFVASCTSLPFVSGQLTGLTDALLTLASGQHIKPNLRENGGLPKPIQAAVEFGSGIGLELEDFVLIDGETGKTPFATLTDFNADTHEPFKGVQHGQFVITSIRVIDKFGQAICAPPPARTPYANVPAFPKCIHPCVSDQLLPTVLNPDTKPTLNVVFGPDHATPDSTTSGYPKSPFIQLTPAINQESRINATFVSKVQKDGTFVQWEPTPTWATPIIGFVVVNYSDSALQFFTSAGVFYTSVRFGGPTGAQQTAKSLPFEQQPNADSTVSDQLQELVKQLMDKTRDSPSADTHGAMYALSLWNTIQDAIQNMPQAPTQYAASANAIVGKPLALVNVGWSLELAQPPLWPQWSPSVLPDMVNDKDPLRTKAELQMSQYRFKVKIGDRDRPFDGVVAYWDTQNQEASGDEKHPPVHPPGSTAFEGFYCYPKPPDTSTALGDKQPVESPGYASKPIDASNYPTLTPYFLAPDEYGVKLKESHPQETPYIQAHTSKLTIKTVLMDPYAPIHLYSAILPIKPLKLPEWTLSEPIRNMTAFTAMGPLLLTKDVSKVWVEAKKATSTSWLQDQTANTKDASKPDVKLAVSGAKGQWRWLQPYSRPSSDSLGAEETTQYLSLTVGQEDGAFRDDPAPYTFVEGFLQLAAPILNA